MKGKLAVVIGASMTGLMAARALADQFESVLVVERDQLPESPEVRKGVPQGAHTHALLLRGLRTAERLFPGLSADLIEHGAVHPDPTADFAWFQQGVYKGRWASGREPILSMTRPLLEWRVRAQLQRQPNVELRSGTRVASLITDPEQSRVTGVRLEAVDGSGTEAVAADLVVDASGRGSRTPHWLEELGYGAVPVTEMKTDVRYVTRIFEYDGPYPGFQVALFQNSFPSTHLCGLFMIEGGRWIVTMQTMLGEEAPATEAEMLAYARGLEAPDLARFMAHARPVTPLLHFRIPSNVRRHYDRLTRFPDGLVTLGDAATAFNPRYGQGMSTAAIGVETLEGLLKSQSPLAPGFSHRFQKALAAATEQAWQMSTSEDEAFLSGGKLPLGARVLNWYMRRFIRLGAVDREALDVFTDLVHLTGPATSLFRPRLVWKVLTLREGELLARLQRPARSSSVMSGS